MLIYFHTSELSYTVTLRACFEVGVFQAIAPVLLFTCRISWLHLAPWSGLVYLFIDKLQFQNEHAPFSLIACSGMRFFKNRSLLKDKGS